jgi:translation initiation factor 1 (eIF-1/SUI1)
MNPFDNLEDNNTTLSFTNDINIWCDIYKGKKNTYISDWNINDDELKNHIKIMKKTYACNGSLKELENSIDNTQTKVVQLQGDHRKSIAEYLEKQGIDKTHIKVKG